MYYVLQSWCKECVKKHTLENRDRDYDLKRKKEYRKKNKTYINKFSRDWQKQNKERAKENYKNWINENRDKSRQYATKRQNKNHIISRNEWRECKSYFNNSCAYCGMSYEEHKETQGQDLHKEHVDDKGSVFLDNCVPACRFCNSSKNTYLLEDWYNEDNPNFTKERLDKIYNWINECHKLYFEGYREKKTRKGSK